MTWYTPNVRIETKDPPQLEDTTSDISKFFEIQFDLLDCYCHWGEPIPCIFEEAETDTLSTDTDLNLTRLKVRTPIIINDFNLHELFTKPMVHDFIEHTIPLMISSFKLPEDFRDEEDEKKKGKAALGRTKLTAEEKKREAELALQGQMLSFEAQKCPERLFPLFKKVLPVIILPQLDQTKKTKQHPYENFSDLIAALQDIKDAYRKSTFRDKFGNPVKIIAEDYDRNIRRPKKEAISSRYVVLEEDDSKRKMSIEKSVHSLSGDSVDKVSSEAEQPPQEASKQQPKAKQGKASHKHRLSKRKSREEAEEVFEEEKIDATTFSKWSTSNILGSVVRLDQKRVTIWTDRLGTFGFTFNRYQHFPFKSWTLQPFEDDPEEVELAIATEKVMFRFYATSKGYKVCASDFVKFYKNRKIYFEIKEPIQDLKELKKVFETIPGRSETEFSFQRLQEKFLNVFPERDASMYIEGYFSEKHYAAECHTYDCMSLYAKNLKFTSSIWNKLSDRRTIVLKFSELRDAEEDMFELKISPEEVLFVEIKELCTELEVISLSYTPTWRNLEFYPDLNHLIVSTFNNALDMRIKDPFILYYLRNLLKAIRPLSCS